MTTTGTEEAQVMISIVLGDAVSLALTDKEDTSTITCDDDEIQWCLHSNTQIALEQSPL